MRIWIRAGLAATLILAVTPALAFTVAPASSTPTARQFTDPDEALETETSALRDSVVENNLRAAGGPLTGETPNVSRSAYGSPATGLGIELAPGAAQTGGATFGPAQSPAALFGGVLYRRSH